MKRMISGLVAVLFLFALIMLVASGSSATAGTKTAGSDASKSGGEKGPAPEPVATGTYAATPTRTPVPFPSGTPVCESIWYQVDSPNAGLDANELEAIDGIGANDLWAVGFYLAIQADGTGYVRANKVPAWQERLERGVSGLGREDDGSSPAVRTLIQHWDGTVWTIVPSPNVGTNDNHLLSIDVLAANDIWTVGYYLNEFGIAQTLAMHWDGSAWTQVIMPSITPYQDSEMLSVEGVATDDVWAVGYSRDDGGVGHPLTLHWDGTEWGVVASPDPPNAEYGSALRDLAVVSANDIWAGGFSLIESLGYGVERTMAMHWDGTQWSVVSTPNIGLATSTFNALDAAGPDDVWAVGYYRDNSYNFRPMAQHWDGTQWTIVFVPTLNSADHLLSAIDVLTSGDVWAVGKWGGYSYAPQSFIAHWDGQVWEPMNGPDYSLLEYNLLVGVKVVGESNVWGVGRATDHTYFSFPANFIAHYGDILSTCDRAFADVPVGSTYYDVVHYLSCRSIFSGYTCGGPGEPCNSNDDPYFHPNAGITRGQLAKIVSNAADFDEDPGYQLFADVSYSDTYYQFVNRLANRGIVTGYACGSTPSEPCYPPYMPLYFRPGASATRGQIAKIVADAKGYTGLPTTQRFQDVPPSHTYYKWVENLATVGAMSGYPCGGPNEPCIAPGNRPYFRSGANATRGQTAKIVTVTFYPGCATGR